MIPGKVRRAGGERSLPPHAGERVRWSKEAGRRWAEPGGDQSEGFGIAAELFGIAQPVGGFVRTARAAG